MNRHVKWFLIIAAAVLVGGMLVGVVFRFFSIRRRKESEMAIEKESEAVRLAWNEAKQQLDSCSPQPALIPAAV